MSIHIEAKAGEIAAAVLLPGDPLRAQYVADTYLENPQCYSRVRGMLGFTGIYDGKEVSVQGTGMGIPSISIYVHELITEYGAKRLIRIGTCGTLREDMKLGEVVLAQAACTDSAVNRIRFDGCDFAPTASFDLLLKAHQAAQQRGVSVRVGTVMTSDTFYSDDPNSWKIWARYGVLAAEMETAALYTLTGGHGVQGLSILTVSDSLVTGETAGSEQRQQGYTAMMEIALQVATT
ncbi:MAG: purine-nucleoside phosphorylase [Spirochaetaceae bacterium]|nr:MAG: purine-nucleoside phosphorylase [Spirochaetaceae bacterium]